MGLAPNIQRKKKFMLKDCVHCAGSFGTEGFAPTKSIFYPDGVIPICNDCIDKMIDAEGGNWSFIDKLCQMSDIPFIPKEWESIAEMNAVGAFYVYSQVFLNSEYDGIGWGDYFDAFRSLRDAGKIEDELPGLSEDKRARLKKLWGANYDDDALDYLDTLYQGLLSTQNINGKLQMDQAQKICKMSYEIDRRIEEGTDFDKLLASYDKLVKAAEFTPKNVKNINDFDSVGELIKWLEKRGWHNTFYDDVPRDIVDETMQNFQAFNQRLYTNESGIGEQITERLNNLKNVALIEKESYYGTDTEYDLDGYENDGYRQLILEEEFDPGLPEDDE